MRSPRLGVVVIGRNEGERLTRCLNSVISQAECMVYVDSGSTDNSVTLARTLGVAVVGLDRSAPFTAGRARNAGVTAVLKRNPQLDFVQFVDGDCELVPGWLARAQAHLVERQEVAIVCGQRRELRRNTSIYNTLCDLEWDGPTGDVDACGGDALVRVAAFDEVGGFVADLIAGEEPELCLRLRRRGWKILRISAAMTLHDARIHSFGQWWRRAQRAGYAYSEGAWRHGLSRERFWTHETGSVWFWGAVLPALFALISCKSATWSLPLLSAYPLLWLRIFGRMRKRKYSRMDASAYATFCVVGKFAQVQGALRFLQRKLTRAAPSLIEYRTA